MYSSTLTKENGQRLSNPNQPTTASNISPQNKPCPFPLLSRGLRGYLLDTFSDFYFSKVPWSCLQDVLGGMLMTTWWIKPMCSNRRPKDCIHVSLLARSLGNVTKDLSLLSLALKLMLTTHLVDGCADIWQLRLTSHNFKAYFCALQSLNESTTLGFAFSFTMNQWTRWT